MDNTWDRLIEQGRIEGIQIGRQIAKERAKARMELKIDIIKKLEVTLRLIKYVPQVSDAKIATMVKVKPKYAKKARTAFSKKRSKGIKKFLRKLFKDLDEVEEWEWKELDKWGVNLWKEFKKKDVLKFKINGELIK